MNKELADFCKRHVVMENIDNLVDPQALRLSLNFMPYLAGSAGIEASPMSSVSAMSSLKSSSKVFNFSVPNYKKIYNNVI